MGKSARLKQIRKLARDLTPEVPADESRYMFSHQSGTWYVKGGAQLARRMRRMFSRGLRGDELVMGAVKQQVRKDRKK